MTTATRQLRDPADRPSPSRLVHVPGLLATAPSYAAQTHHECCQRASAADTSCQPYQCSFSTRSGDLHTSPCSCTSMVSPSRTMLQPRMTHAAMLTQDSYATSRHVPCTRRTHRLHLGFPCRPAPRHCLQTRPVQAPGATHVTLSCYGPTDQLST